MTCRILQSCVCMHDPHAELGWQLFIIIYFCIFIYLLFLAGFRLSFWWTRERVGIIYLFDEWMDINKKKKWFVIFFFFLLIIIILSLHYTWVSCSLRISIRQKSEFSPTPGFNFVIGDLSRSILGSVWAIFERFKNNFLKITS